jgi:DNA-binding transcriptional LysR family regulator
LEGARVAIRCDNPLIQLKAAANEVGIAELACFLGDSSRELVRIWPDEPPARRTAWLVIHQDMRRSARIRVVSASIGEAFRRQRKTLEQGSRADQGQFDTSLRESRRSNYQDARVSNR